MQRSTPTTAWPWWRWLAPRPFDWVATFLYLCVLGLFALRQSLASPSGGPGLPVVGMAAASVALLALDRWEWWRYPVATPRREALWLFWARLLLIELVVQMEGFGLAAFLYVLVPFAAALTFSSRSGWLASALVWAVFVAKMVWFKPYWAQSPDLVNSLVLFTMALIFMQAMARLVTLERSGRSHTEWLLADLEQSHARLTAYAHQVEALATTSERNRIAREIHDSLGHYLTVINVQLEKALAFREKHPAQAEQAVRDSKRLAHNALDDVRRSVGMLRANGQVFGLAQALHELIAPLQSERLHVELTIEGNQSGFSQAALLALFRGAQEGLTNVQRHATASQATLHLSFQAVEASLEICDNGVGFEPGTVATGAAQGRYGLQGLRERLELVGGSMALKSTPGSGTSLLLRVPRG
ncbi:MAG: sensor histidine kinase [Chloroflexaceae bacterium]|nr:sensor histidine kinase [Chloroflexaceae bacterium]